MRYHFFHKASYISVLNTEVKGTRLLVFKVFWRFIIFELNHVNTNFTASRYVSYFKIALAFATKIDIHLTNGCICFFGNNGQSHYVTPAHNFTVNFCRFLYIRNGYSDM
jgi:hypothetical protein